LRSRLSGYARAVLVLTEDAQGAIRGIVEESGVGPNGGLRISGANEGNGETALEFDVAHGPADGDEVVTDGGATVFLDETASALLTDKLLDVHTHGDHFHFSVDEQSG
jgi:iron-sulfur cluster assembly protein